nr:E3 ubiquitin-protein ligase MARCHF9-like isoform X2 [Syngnathus scovelli]
MSSTGSQNQKTQTGSSMTGEIGGSSGPPLKLSCPGEEEEVKKEEEKEEEVKEEEEKEEEDKEEKGKKYCQVPGDKVKHLQEDAEPFDHLAESEMCTPQCRICFQGPDKGELLSPCRCDGSVRYSHQSCLVRWIRETGSWNCEICRFKYRVHSVCTKNPLKWQSISLTLIEKAQISAIILGLMFLIASLGWLIWSIVSPFAEFQRNNYIFQILYGMYVFMDFVCIGLVIQEGPSVYRIIRHWHTMNKKWRVLNYDKTKDLTSSRKNGARDVQSHTAEVPHNGQEPRRSCITFYVGNIILSIFNRLRRPNHNNHNNNNNRADNHEVVMRVTPV